MAKKIKLNDKDNDFIGSNKDEKIFGNGGDDSISGAGGNDVVNGGDGNDTLKGGAGDDRLVGEAGNDLLLGGAGDDTLNAGTGTNTVQGGEGDDTLVIAANQADVTIAQNGDEWTFTLADGTVTTASGVEVVRFSDGSVLVEDLEPTDPGTGETFTLTSGVDNFVGGANNDTFQGLAADLTTFDNLQGNGGDDVLNLIASAAVAVPAGATVAGIETVNVDNSVDDKTVSAAGFVGATAVWQITNAGAITGLEAGATAGFRNTAIDALTDTITYAAGATAANVEVDGVTSGSTVAVLETTAGDIKSVTVSGDVATAGALTVDTSGTTATSTINLGLTTNGTVTLTTDVAVVTTVDASASTGNLTFDVSAITALTSVKGGSGNDTIDGAITGLTAAAVTFDLGAGNDVLGFDGTGGADTTVTVTLGAGNDTFRVDTALTNVSDTVGYAADLITVADFDAAADVLDLQALGARDVLNNTELANISGAATLDAAIALAVTATTEGSVSLFEYGGDVYVLNNIDVAGDAALTNVFEIGDGLLKIEDTTLAEFTASNLLV